MNNKQIQRRQGIHIGVVFHTVCFTAINAPAVENMIHRTDYMIIMEEAVFLDHNALLSMLHLILISV